MAVCRNLVRASVFCLTFLSLNLSAGGFQEETKILTEEDVKEIIFKTPFTLYGASTEGMHKAPIRFQQGDIQATFGGTVKVQYYRYDDMYLLNSRIPDQDSVFKQSMDFTLDVIYGQKRYGHKAFELFVDLRSKNKWGIIGSYKSTSAKELKLGNLSLGEHDHQTGRNFPWFKDAWLATSLNSAFNIKNLDTLHFLKLGWFPYKLANGIALGGSYGLIYENLGLYSYVADSSAPGINLYGDIVKDKLSYSLYYAMFEDKSGSLSSTFNDVKKNHVNKRYRPWRGVAKDDELWSASIKWKALDNKKCGKLDLNPYIYFNEASDQKVDVPNDCKTQLGAYGMSLDYNKSNFELSGEVAFNYGNEFLYEIDRNKVELKLRKYNEDIPDSTDTTASDMYQVYSHVVYYDNPSIPAPVNKYSERAVLINMPLEPGVQYPISCGHGEDKLTNKTGRIRPAYKNRLRGWMGFLGAAYHFDDLNFKFGAEYAYASGDDEPHQQTVNKTYHGFIGLHELFSGKKVTSAIVLGERVLNRPFGLDIGESLPVRSKQTFSDLQYFGISGTWTPEKLKSKNCKLNSNLMFFWKSHKSQKYVSLPLDQCNFDTSYFGYISTSERASKFMGTELNFIGSYELYKDLIFTGVFACFFPGNFFKDVKGVPIKGIFNVSNPVPGETPLPNLHSLSDDTAFFIDLSLTYKF